MEQMGIPILSAHMFLLYYAVLSALTPPVAVAAYAAASIAEDNPLLIAALAVKFALAAFIVPFAFVYGPELLLVGSPLKTVISFTTAALGLIVLAIAIEGHFREPVPPLVRVPLGLAAVGLIMPFTESTITGAVVAMVLLSPTFIRRAFNR